MPNWTTTIMWHPTTTISLKSHPTMRSQSEMGDRRRRNRSSFFKLDLVAACPIGRRRSCGTRLRQYLSRVTRRCGVSPRWEIGVAETVVPSSNSTWSPHAQLDDDDHVAPDYDNISQESPDDAESVRDGRSASPKP